MTKKNYILDENDPEYKNWILSKQRSLLVNKNGEFVYQYDHSEPKYHEDGQWVHVMTPITGKGQTFKSSFHLGSSPGRRPMPSTHYHQSKKLRVGDLPKNQYGHIQLTDYHYNYISSVAIEISRTDYLIALKVEEDYSNIGLIKGYYLVDISKNIIAIGDIRYFFDCDHFIAKAIKSMRFA